MRRVSMEGSTGGRLRLLAVVVFLLAAAFFVTVPRPAAAGGTAFLCEYYSDASMTVQVGERTRDCAGVRTGWGSTSAYSNCTLDACCGNTYC